MNSVLFLIRLVIEAIPTFNVHSQDTEFYPYPTFFVQWTPPHGKLKSQG
jgi:hypothetical protein